VPDHAESLVCPVCATRVETGRSGTVPYPGAGSGPSGMKPESIVFCGSCGVGIALPAWSAEDMDRYYSGGNFWSIPKTEILSPRRYSVHYALAESRWRQVEPLLGKNGNPVSILDFGAGHGFFGMAAARSRRVRLFRYVCVEKDKAMVESLKRTWPVLFPEITLELYDRAEDAGDAFDCVCLSQVLEHLSEPRPLIGSLVRKLVPGGMFFAEVPHRDDMFKKDVFPHVLFFDPGSLRRLLERPDLEIVSVDGWGNDRERSPFASRNASPFRAAGLKIILRLRGFIPLRSLLRFISRFYEMDVRRDRGVWVRAICRRAAAIRPEQ
jgi:SAM-dependent methyltransferase